MNALDRLARAAADLPSNGEARLTRRDFAARGLLGLLALTVSSRVGVTSVALGATQPCTSLRICLDKAASAANNAFWKCQGSERDLPQSEWLIESMGCRLWTYHPVLQKGHRECLTTCPPRRTGPRPKVPPRRAPAPPPPLPPHLYGPVLAECANCASVGGKCCYGHDPLHLCACAHPDYDCAERYGCG